MSFKKTGITSRRNDALSELVGAIILVGVITAGAGLISVIMLSSPSPDRIVNVDIDLISQPSDVFADFLHTGGDPLFGEQIFIRSYLDGNLIDIYSYSTAPRIILSYIVDGIQYFDKYWNEEPNLNEPWKYGSILRIPRNGADSYHIIYKTGNGEYLLKKIDYGGVSPLPSPPPSCPGVNALFSIITDSTDITGRTLEFHPSSSFSAADGYRWKWVISGPNYQRTFDEQTFTETFPHPVGTTGDRYVVTYSVSNYQDNTLICESSHGDSFFVPGCLDTPINADFSWRYNTVGEVEFRDQSQGVIDGSRSRWVFTGGDPSNVNGFEPSSGVRFSGAGPHYATLSVIGGSGYCTEGQTSSNTKQIAGPLCAVENTFAITFLNYNSVGNQWNYRFDWNPSVSFNQKDWELIWDFGDNSPVQKIHKDDWTGQYPHSYNYWGKYPVTLTIKPHGCPEIVFKQVVTIGPLCLNPPTADFTINKISGTPFTISVTDNSIPSTGKPIVNWEWSWGDGDRVIGQYPLPHPYVDCQEKRDYPITLKVMDSSSCTDEKTVAVYCDCDKPTAEFRYNIITLNPYVVEFIANTAGITSWSWDFGDGQISTDPSPQNPYSEVKPYSVLLTVANDCGSDETTQTIHPDCGRITPAFDLGVISESPLRIRLDDHSIPRESIARWKWDFGDGYSDDYTSYKVFTEHSYSVPGDYIITLSTWDRCGNLESTRKSINCPPVGALNFDPVTSTGPAPHPVTFDLTEYGTATRFIWSFGDGSVIEKTVGEPDFETIPHEYRRSGTYPVTLTAYSDCGSSAIATGQVTVTCPSVKADFTIVPTIDKVSNRLSVVFTDISPSTDDITQWRWDFGDGESVTWNRAQWEAASRVYTHPYPKIAPYTAKLTVSNDCGRTDSKTMLINSETPCPDIIADFSYSLINPPLHLQFTDTSQNATRWHWDFGDGSDSDQKSPEYRYTRSGLYVVTLTAYNECGMASVKRGEINLGCQDVTADFGFEYLTADPASKQLEVRFTDVSQGHGLNIVKWRWDFGDGKTTLWTHSTRPVDGQIVHPYPELAPYTAILEVENECGSVDKVQKLVYNGSLCEDIVANFRPLTTKGQAPFTVNFVDLSIGGPTRWHWDFGDNNFGEVQKTDTVTRGDISHTYETVGQYIVTLIATGECGKAGVKSGYVDVECDNVSIDFRYQINNLQNEEPLNVTFFITEPNDPDELDKIVKWTWLFDDGTVSHEFNPTHVYTDRLQYDVMVFAENYCGNSGRNQRSIILDCRNLTPWFNVNPQRGVVPLTVFFDENSTPVQHIKAWRWYFGDGGYYYTTDSMFPAPESYTYVMPGIFNITLVVQNECTQQFSMNRTVEVIPTYNVTAYSNEGGTISPPGTTMVVAGDTLTYTITNNTCFDIGDVKIDESSIGKVDTYTFTNIQSDHTINVTFVPQGPYSIDTSVNIVNPDSSYTPGGGSIIPSGNVIVPCGESQTFTIRSELCYNMVDVVINKTLSLGPQSSPYEYTFSDVRHNQSIDAYFSLKKFNITSSADPGGVIDPLGITQLDCGSDKTYTITADPCFNISNVIINGTEHLGAQQSPFSYTFTNVTSDQSIHAIFARKTFPITATAGTGGSISPLGITYVPCGFDQTYTITSNDCYNITSVIVDGTPLSGPFNSPFTYTFNNVQEPHTIHAEFTQRSNIITAEAGLGGTITPSGLVTVPCGTNRRFDITPDSGYAILNVLVNGISVGPVSNYTFTNVRTNQTIQAIFTVKTDCYTISGRITNQLTGAPVAGIRVDAYFQATPQTFQAYATSHPDGYYTIYLPYPPPPAPRTYFVRCPDTVTWVTTNPLSKQINNIEINPGGGAKCDPINIDFQGRPL